MSFGFFGFFHATTTLALRRKPKPTALKVKIKKYIIDSLGGIRAAARLAVTAGLIKLVPLFGEGILEAKRIRSFLKTFLYSTKVVILICFFFKTIEGKMLHREQLQAQAASVITRYVRKYVEHKRAERIAREALKSSASYADYTEHNKSCKQS